MTDELKEKIQSMSEDKLHDIIENKDEYLPELVEYVNEILGIQSSVITENVSEELKETASSPKAHNKNTLAIICIVCCAIICIVTMISAIFIVNQNNKKEEVLKATQRIDKLVEEIYMVDSSMDEDYLLAKDKLVEIKTLIEENDIEGLPLTKYNDAGVYLTDLKTLDDIWDLYTKSDIDSIKYVKDVDVLMRRITDEKVRNKLAKDVDLLSGLAGDVKRVILGNAFYKAQEAFTKKYPDCTIMNIGEFNPSMYISDNYTFILNNYANEISMNGIKGTVSSESEAIKYRWINGEMLASTVDTIKSEGGYAIFVSYYKNDDEFTLYPPTRTVYWKVGVDVSAELTDHGIAYNIKRYTDGEIETRNGLTTDEALKFVMLNPS